MINENNTDKVERALELAIHIKNAINLEKFKLFEKDGVKTFLKGNTRFFVYTDNVILEINGVNINESLKDVLDQDVFAQELYKHIIVPMIEMDNKVREDKAKELVEKTFRINFK